MTACASPRSRLNSQDGFSLPELLISVTILLIISSAVTGGLLQLTNQQKTISNRTQLHAGVRSATELLQQEVGQAGRIALPGSTTLSVAVGVGTATVGVKMSINGATCGSNNVSVACVAGLYLNEWLVIDGGTKRESVQVTAIDTAAKQITVQHSAEDGVTIIAGFALAHAAGAAVNVLGGFASGIVPDKYFDGVAWQTYPNGSDARHLKLFGDVNGDGSMVYVEYTCDTDGGSLYRKQVAFDAAAKTTLTNSDVLLGNIQANPVIGGTQQACFTYMPNPRQYLAALVDTGCGAACIQGFVLDVAITLTVKTQQIDPITRVQQTETKALLNVSPRNVFDVWQLASANLIRNNDRVQSMPATVKALLACVDSTTLCKNTVN